jgi:hypothetical protein
MPYPRGASPNFLLDVANLFLADLGAPALAVANRFVASTNMANGAYTIANQASADGLARNVVATISAVTGNDTPGSILITGTGADGRALTETLALTAGGTATGLKCFATVTSIVQSGWVITSGNDTIVIGTGNRVQLPAAIKQRPAVSATSQVKLVMLGTSFVAVSAGINADIAQCWVDGAAGTYDGTKKLLAFIAR